MKMKAAIARLENRLEKCFNRQNLTEAMNKQLKLSIDDLRYEKQQLLRSNAKGEQQLAKRKGQLRHAMTETNRVMDLKEQIKRELESLKVSTMAEIDEFTETFEGLSSGLHEAMDTSKTREAHKAADAARDGALVVSKSSKTKKVEDDAAAQERKKLDMDEMRDETMKACVRDCAGAEPVPLVCDRSPRPILRPRRAVPPLDAGTGSCRSGRSTSRSTWTSTPRCTSSSRASSARPA